MIVRIDGYDQDLKKFVTLSSDEIEKICKLYKGLSPQVPCQLRIGGLTFAIAGFVIIYYMMN